MSMRQREIWGSRKLRKDKACDKKRVKKYDECQFACYCDSWLAAKSPSVKASSLAKYERDMENHIKPFFGGLQPYDVTSKEIEAFTRMLLQEQNLSPKTVRSILITLHSVLSYIEKRAECQLKKPEIIYPKENRKAIRVLNKEEEKQLARFLMEKMDLFKLGVYMAMRTGMRIGELCALRWRDISFETGTIFIRHTVQRIRSKDAAFCAKTEVMLGPPKSDSSDRAIPLMPDLESLCRVFCEEDAESFVLTGSRQCMDPRKLQRRLKKYTEECGLEGVHFHTLRHTFATRCVEAGFDMKTLSEILGHSDIGITMNQYVHPDMDSKRANMSRLKTVL